jgi:hypothetical protein
MRAAWGLPYDGVKRARRRASQDIVWQQPAEYPVVRRCYLGRRFVLDAASALLEGSVSMPHLDRASSAHVAWLSVSGSIA